VSRGILGGTFNPLHNAHLRLAEVAREALDLATVLFVPAGDPPLKRAGIAPAADRLEMVRSATASNTNFEVSDLEVGRSGPSYTVDTLRELSRRFPGDPLWFILGSDAMAGIDRWAEPAVLFGLASFAVVERPGWNGAPRELLPASLATGFRDGPHGLIHDSGKELRTLEFAPLSISASDIRERVARRASIRYLVPDEVIDYIEKHQLYREIA
jgi:nicotinate-nucleotide adenylyltransferase